MGSLTIFTETLLHSLWQSAILLFSFNCNTFFFPKTHPLQNRNILYFLLLFQCIISIATYIFMGNHIYFFTVILNYSGNNNFRFIQFADILFYTWIIILLLKSFLLLFQWMKFKNSILKTLLKAGAAEKNFLKIKSNDLRIKKNVALWYSKEINAPFTFGFLKPVILLPFSFINNVTTTEVEAIILHELCHIKNKDYLLNIGLIIIETFYFFNPFIRVMAAKIKLEREKNCDVQVMQYEYNALMYAQLLLRIARKKHVIQSFGMSAIAKKPSALFFRITFFSNSANLNFSSLKLLNFLPVLSIIIVLWSITISVRYPLKYSDTIPVKTVKKYQKIAVAENYKNKYAVSNLVNLPKTLKELNYSLAKKKTKSTAILFKSFNATNEIKIPVFEASMNNTPDSVKEFIYFVETPAGSVSNTFKIIFKNGKWQMEPLWIITEKNTDSSYQKMLKDSIQ